MSLTGLIAALNAESNVKLELWIGPAQTVSEMTRLMRIIVSSSRRVTGDVPLVIKSACPFMGLIEKLQSSEKSIREG